jgi:hypothetical protein
MQFSALVQYGGDLPGVAVMQPNGYVCCSVKLLEGIAGEDMSIICDLNQQEGVDFSGSFDVVALNQSVPSTVVEVRNFLE